MSQSSRNATSILLAMCNPELARPSFTGAADDLPCDSVEPMDEGFGLSSRLCDGNEDVLLIVEQLLFHAAAEQGKTVDQVLAAVWRNEFGSDIPSGLLEDSTDTTLE